MVNCFSKLGLINYEIQKQACNYFVTNRADGISNPKIIGLMKQS